MAGLAFAGYYYTAEQFALRIEGTIWLLVGCLYLRALLLRLVLVHRRRLSIEQARERRAAAEERATSSDAAATANISTEAEKWADIAKISFQTQRLLSVALMTFCFVGFWWIWIDMVPALNFLDRWPLWTTTVQVTEEVANAAGEKASRLVDKTEPITVANLAAAILIAVITVISARNVPGVLEMSLLQRLPVDAAGRYAATTIAKYVIVMLGVVLAGTAIGVGWSKIQWLATALTFGLAFGLQEIFANFVAGVIILFERPVRVGDVVTVGDVSGVVSRIRIRATTITNWDRKEYIVPNKEFITGRLLNWTLSDTTNRVVLHVGVAYGTDADEARKLLLEAAREQPAVLDEPAPTATFEQFWRQHAQLLAQCLPARPWRAHRRHAQSAYRRL
jgi:potassium efflux system protein